MFTYFQTGYETYQIRGLANDEKPTDVENGAEYYAMDTGDYYYYDAPHMSWIKSESGRWL